MNAGYKPRLLAPGPNYHVLVGNEECFVSYFASQIVEFPLNFRSNKQLEFGVSRSRWVCYLWRLLNDKIAVEHDSATGGSR